MSLSRALRLAAGRGAIMIVSAWSLCLVAGCSGARPAAGTGTAGGTLTTSFRTEPHSFNRLVGASAAEQRISLLTQSSLVRVNPITDELEPRLASSWTSSADRLTWTLRLRDGVVFSDGQPFSSADVVFTMAALYDAKVNSEMASAFRIGGQPITARALDAHTVVLTFPSAYAPGLRLFDALPILPKHKLDTFLSAGTMRDGWGMSTTPSEVVGTGPFVLVAAVPGQSLRFTRNPHYWAKDDEGRTLPYLDEVDVQIVPNQDAEMLRLESGDVDVINDFTRPEDAAAIDRLSASGALAVTDAGVTLDPSALWFDLAPDAKAAHSRPWLQREEFRQAISLAVDRQAIVDSVYLGAAVPIAGPVTPGFGAWYAGEPAVPARDVPKARQLLASIGFRDRKGDGMLEDATGAPATFTILTQKGKTDRERTAALIAEQLKQAGLDVDVVALDRKALGGHIGADDYEGIYYGAQTTSRDPAENLDFWLSSGAFHFWNLHEDTAPATPWEAEIDDLTRRQAASSDVTERRKLFVTIRQTLFAHVPAIYLAAAKATVAVSSRVGGVQAAVLQPPVLWNVDRLTVRASGNK